MRPGTTITVYLTAVTLLVMPAIPATGQDRSTHGHGLELPDGMTLCLKGLLQPRIRYDVGEMGDAADTREDDRRVRAFVRRARLTVCGSGPYEAIGWKLQVAWDRGEPSLKDASVDLTLSKKWLILRAGQFKAPSSRQFLTSGSRQQLIDRSITHSFFGATRDLGAMVHNGFEKSPAVEYALGVFNGAGDKARFVGSVDDDGQVEGSGATHEPFTAHPVLVGRIGWNHGKIKGYSEGDLEGGPLRLAVGLSGVADFDGALDESIGATLGVDGSLDAAVKLHGLSATAAGFLLTSEVDGSLELEGWGSHGQVGFLTMGWLEPVVRTAFFDKQLIDETETEVAGTLNVYLDGHKVKWSTGSIWLVTEKEPEDQTVTELVFETQLQVAF